MFVAAKPQWNREKAEGGGGRYGGRNKSEREREGCTFTRGFTLCFGGAEEPGWVLLVDQLLTHAESRTKQLVTK